MLILRCINNVPQWLALINVESMLCVGTGRTPLSHRTALDHAVIDSSLTHSIESSRDVRLELMGQIFEITEGGLRIHFPGTTALPKFYREVTGVLMKLDNILRMILPLPGTHNHFGLEVCLWISYSRTALGSRCRKRMFLLSHPTNLPPFVPTFVHSSLPERNSARDFGWLRKALA